MATTDIPLQGTIRRCPHSVYWPENQKFAHACGFCNPDLYSVTKSPMKHWQVPVAEVPVFAQTKHDSEMPYANANYRTKALCPECNSNVHYKSEDAGGPWTCGDCGHKWKGRAE
jgi:hypothetical protein